MLHADDVNIGPPQLEQNSRVRPVGNDGEEYVVLHPRRRDAVLLSVQDRKK